MDANREIRWYLRPPPGASFQQHAARGLLICFQRGLESVVETFLRQGMVYTASNYRAPMPTWVQPPPLPAGTTEWELSFPPYCQVYQSMSPDMGGLVSVGLEGAGPGALTIRFPAGHEVDVQDTYFASLDRAAGKMQARSVVRPAAPVARSSRHIPPILPPQPTNPTQAVAEHVKAIFAEQREAAQLAARRVANEFFNRLEPKRIEVPLCTECGYAKDSDQCALFHAALAFRLNDFHAPDTDAPPDTPRNIAPPTHVVKKLLIPPPPPIGPGGMVGPPTITQSSTIPDCTCPSAIRGTGAHIEGCPQENIPPGFIT